MISLFPFHKTLPYCGGLTIWGAPTSCWVFDNLMMYSDFHKQHNQPRGFAKGGRAMRKISNKQRVQRVKKKNYLVTLWSQRPLWKDYSWTPRQQEAREEHLWLTRRPIMALWRCNELSIDSKMPFEDISVSFSSKFFCAEGKKSVWMLSLHSEYLNVRSIYTMMDNLVIVLQHHQHAFWFGSTHIWWRCARKLATCCEKLAIDPDFKISFNQGQAIFCHFIMIAPHSALGSINGGKLLAVKTPRHCHRGIGSRLFRFVLRSHSCSIRAHVGTKSARLSGKCFPATFSVSYCTGSTQIQLLDEFWLKKPDRVVTFSLSRWRISQNKAPLKLQTWSIQNTLPELQLMMRELGKQGFTEIETLFLHPK